MQMGLKTWLVSVVLLVMETCDVQTTLGQWPCGCWMPWTNEYSVGPMGVLMETLLNLLSPCLVYHPRPVLCQLWECLCLMDNVMHTYLRTYRQIYVRTYVLDVCMHACVWGGYVRICGCVYVYAYLSVFVCLCANVSILHNTETALTKHFPVKTCVLRHSK